MKGETQAQWQMNNFQAAVDDCGLRDIMWEGYQYTYDNGQIGDANRQCMLDRAMCTSAWLEVLPFAMLLHLDREWSDHAPIKLLFDKQDVGGTRRRRKRKQLVRLNGGARTQKEAKRRRKLVAGIAELYRQEEQYWRQISRALWLHDRDRNTKFFHARAGERKRKNHIWKLIDDNGVERFGDNAVSAVAVSYSEVVCYSEPN
ncbi:uncharacterized protein LOC141628821 [Silene latifolia]|uniref:uncharacterized protein LOC141628821 n=1 Tax=Silene latifolia TaxID=37657 RepID=UPI003D77F24D